MAQRQHFRDEVKGGNNNGDKNEGVKHGGFEGEATHHSTAVVIAMRGARGASWADAGVIEGGGEKVTESGQPAYDNKQTLGNANYL
jgi:hypothetical protein